jgi:sodium-independent sulfate anion transporter 11
VIASALAFLSGAVILLLGLLRIGWLVDFISLAAVSACTQVSTRYSLSMGEK